MQNKFVYIFYQRFNKTNKYLFIKHPFIVDNCYIKIYAIFTSFMLYIIDQAGDNYVLNL